MNMSRTKIIALGIAAAVLLLIYLAYLTLTFRIVSITPALNDRFATSTSEIVISFNMPLADGITYYQNISDPNEIIRSVRTEDKRLHLELQNVVTREHTFTLKGIRSKGGKTLSNKTFNFKAVYVPFDQLSEEEKKQQVENTDKGNKQDPIEQHLPYGGANFYLIASYVTDVNDPGVNDPDVELEPISKLELEATLYLTGADVRINRDQAIENYRQEVFNYIRSKGFDPAAYTIRFVISEPPS